MAIDSSSGEQGAARLAAPWAGWRFVSPGYFRAVGLRLIRGRTFDENDKPVWGEPGEPAPLRRVVISERLAKRIFPNVDPVGKHAVLWKGQGNLDAEVIGVMADSRERGLASNASLTVYLPYGPNVLPGEFVVHTRGNPLALMPTVRSIVASLDSNLPVADVRSFEEVVQRSVAPQRFNAILLGIFSGLALLLATTGPLRSALVLDEPADFGDRAPRRFGGEQPQHFGYGDRPGNAAGVDGDRTRRGRGVVAVALFCDAAVRRQTVRHSHVRRGGGIAAGHGAAGLLSARPSGDARRSGSGAAD